MSSESINLGMAGSRKRRIKDKLAKYGVTTGGALVLVALLLIFFYLLYVVKPIFNGATMEPTASFTLPVAGKTAWLGVEEQNEIGYRFSDKGQSTSSPSRRWQGQGGPGAGSGAGEG